MKSYKVKELLDKYNKYNLNLIIKTNNKNFCIIFNKMVLPHLLGLQYLTKKKLGGYDSVKFMDNHNLSDQEILDRVEKYHGENQKLSVERRINTLDEFLKNLEKSILVEKTLDNKLPINYLLIQDEHTKEIKHLGICSTDNGALPVSYDSLSKDTKDFFRTYFVRNDKDYFNKTKIYEEIKSIQIYDEKLKEYTPFSFDENKNRYLLERYKENKNMNYQEVIKEYNNKNGVKENTVEYKVKTKSKSKTKKSDRSMER